MSNSDGSSGGGGAAPDGVFTIRVGTPLAEIEERVLEETLRFAKGNRTVTAKLLGIDPKTVFRKLKQIEADENDGESAEKPAES